MHSLDKRISTHEAVCSERQGTILKRLARLESILWGAVAALLLVQLDFVKQALASVMKHVP